jgi:hypothetical protein
MQKNPFLSGMAEGFKEGVLVFVAPLRPIFWRTLVTRGPVAALRQAKHPGRVRRPG